GREQGFCQQDHPGAPAVGAIVDAPVPVGGELAQIDEPDNNPPRLPRAPQYPALEHAREQLREDRDDIKSHLFRSIKPSGRSTTIRFCAIAISLQISARAGTMYSSPLRSTRSWWFPARRTTSRTTPSARPSLPTRLQPTRSWSKYVPSGSSTADSAPTSTQAPTYLSAASIVSTPRNFSTSLPPCSQACSRPIRSRLPRASSSQTSSSASKREG